MNETNGRDEASEYLDADRIVETIGRLKRRIEERFGTQRGLYHVCGRLEQIAAQAKARSQWIARPIIGLRLATACMVLVILAAAVSPLFVLALGRQHMDEFAEFVQVLEPAMNVVVLIGAAVFFLLTLERRIKRQRALRAIHEVRAVAHVIDMHQLTKDPDRMRSRIRLTSSSPRQELTPSELGRYLNYCTEMLALAGKIAALYVQHFDDAVAIASANQVEQLCSDLARKIWQKIAVLPEIEQ